jgi:hypothetical protein
MLLELGNLTFDWDELLNRHLQKSIASIMSFLYCILSRKPKSSDRYSNRTVLVVVGFTVISLMLLELGNLTFDWDDRLHCHLGKRFESI